ncbi:MAG: hypothetical protein H7267_14390 [Sandarakinorhabdus sp.]|nr:hypothetical protein [Sandarakinorhabdus sp.]
MAVRPWLVASLLLLAGQVAAGLLWPAAVLITVVGLGGQALIIVHYAMIQGARQRRQRTLWWLLATAMMMWALGFASIFVLKDVLFADDSHALIDSLLFVARGAPIMLMLTSGIDEEAYGRVWWLDLAQAGVFIAAAWVLLLGNPLSAIAGQNTGPAPDDVAHQLRTLQFMALIVLAIGVATLHRSRASALVFQPPAAMLLGYVISANIVNRLFLEAWHVPSGSAWRALGTAPMLVFLAVRANPLLAPTAPVSGLAAGAGLLASAVLSPC